jgi:hypothetical protein
MKISCLNCGKSIRRGWRYAETHSCFCSPRCHNLWRSMTSKVQKDQDEQDCLIKTCGRGQVKPSYHAEEVD